MADFKFHTDPFPHQLEDFEATKDIKTWAYFWAPGLGKTWININIARYLYETGKIDALLITAPNGVQANWLYDELPAHLPPTFPWEGMVWWPSVAGKYWFKGVKDNLRSFMDQQDRLLVLATSYHSFLQDRSYKVIQQFLKERKVMWVLDESDDIGNPSAQWTRRIMLRSSLARIRRISTGSPYKDGSPLPYWSQFQFLHPDILRCPNYKSFKLKYAEWFLKPLPGKPYKQMIPVKDPRTGRQKFKNLDQLEKLISIRATRRSKDEHLKFLPPKLYDKLYVELSREQTEVYARLQEQSELLKLDTGEVSIIEMAMLVRLRLQQVLSGFYPSENDEPEQRIPGDLPRLESTLDLIHRHNEQQIVWARFTTDINLICAGIEQKGDSVVRYDGRVDNADREHNKRAFMAGDVKVLVANAKAMSRGHTLVNCHKVIYYTNYPNLLPREQSEDRVHRPGQHNACLYTDIVCPDTVDVNTLIALRSKMNVADFLMGRPRKEWI